MSFSFIASSLCSWINRLAGKVGSAFLTLSKQISDCSVSWRENLIKLEQSLVLYCNVYITDQ